MIKEDYTKTKDEEIRGKIEKLFISMVTNEDRHGIYPAHNFVSEVDEYIESLCSVLPTAEFISKMEAYILGLISKKEEEINQKYVRVLIGQKG